MQFPHTLNLVSKLAAHHNITEEVVRHFAGLEVLVPIFLKLLK